MFLDSLVEFFNARGFEAVGVRDGAGLDAALDETGADLVVLDVVLENEDGVRIAERLSRERDVGIMILTCRRTEESDQAAGLLAGADAYLAKGSDLLLIEAAARSVLRRRAGGRAAGTTGAPWRLDPLAWTLAAPGGGTARLTAAEVKVLEILFRAAGTAVARDTFLAALGKQPSETARRSLEATVRRLRRKVEAETGTPFPVRTAYASGFAFTAPSVIA